MKKVWCIPTEVETNKYMAQMQNAIRKAGYYVYGKGNKIKKLLFCDIVHLNWYEDISPSANKRISFVKKAVFLDLLKVMNKKVIYTLHNKKPHDDNNGLSRRLMKQIIDKADAIIIHSKSSFDIIKGEFDDDYQKKTYYIPLPNYNGVYHDIKQYPFCFNDNKFRVAFIGQVRPYKNVETIIKVANMFSRENRIFFLICGKCISNEYKNKIISSVDNTNVTLDLRFIEDDEIYSLMNCIDCVVLPYSTESALNSAAAMLAFSFGKCVVSTNTGTILDIKEKSGIACYEYSPDENTHVERLYNGIKDMFMQWNADKAQFNHNGNELKEYVDINCSVESISEELKKVYS